MTSELKISSEDKKSWVLLSAFELSEECDGGPNLSISVSAGAFSATAYGWSGREELMRFQVAVAECERTRTGNACLTSSYPGELELRIEQTDSTGHFRLCYRVEEFRHTRGGLERQRLQGELPLDAELFGCLIRDLNDFVQEAVG